MYSCPSYTSEIIFLNTLVIESDLQVVLLKISQLSYNNQIMQRTLEPEEIMDKEENVLAYAKADFSSVNQKFVDALIKKYPNIKIVLDLGCGPGDIPVRLAKALPNVHITAIDASKKMIASAKASVTKARLNNHITLVRAYLPGLPFKSKTFDAIISNSILHHLPNPLALWEEIKLLGKNEAAIFITDLVRPNSKEKAREMVECYTANEHPVLKEDFYNSLLAAFTLDEVKAQLIKANLPNLNAEIISDRHWLVSGIL